MPRIKHPAVMLCACAAVAVTAAVAVDRHLERERKKWAASQSQANPAMMQAPSITRWKPVILEPGTKAPTFDLSDVRTGKRVRLEDLHAGRPVVMMLSSFG